MGSEGFEPMLEKRYTRVRRGLGIKTSQSFYCEASPSSGALSLVCILVASESLRGVELARAVETREKPRS